MERLTAGFVLRERYQLARRLASGGMGAVWQASDLLLDRPVAIKIMHPHTAAERELASRFHDEAQYSAKLNSPHTVGVYDYGEDNGLAFLVMELVPGQTVAQLIRDRGALDPEFVRSTIAQVASGLDTAHRWGIVHRDVKPSNIMVTPEGEAKLGDFGIARAVDGSSRTRTGEIFGTPQYLSPEQAQGLPTSPASDLYSLGVVAHEMLTGVRPFERTTPLATALAHVNEPPPPLPDAIPAPLADAIVACLQKDPADRPESAAVLARLLGMPAPVPTRSGAEVLEAVGPGVREPLPVAVPPPAPVPRAPRAGAPEDRPGFGWAKVLLASASTVLVVLLCLAAIFL